MSEGQTPCSVRAEVQSLVDREISHLQKLIERTIAEKEVALQLQRTEYLRRLEELNNAHVRAERAVLATVPRETYDLFVVNYNNWKEYIQSETTTIRAAQATRDKIFYIAIAMIGLVFSAITFFMSFKSK